MLLEFIKRIAGKWVTGKVVTLDIDDTSLRLLETRGGTVLKWASMPIEPGTVEGGATPNRRALGRTVKQLMASNDIKTRKVTASLNGLYSVSRVLPISTVPEGLTTQDFVMEMAREVMPLAMSRVYFSWQMVVAGEGEGGGEGRVLILGVPREMVDGEVQALKAVGVNPHVLELKAMALTRVVNREQALVLNIEPASFDAVVIADDVPEIMRTIAWKQDELSMEDKVEHLVGNLELTVDFYNSRHIDTPLDPATPLFITGQMSTDFDLIGKLQAGLRYPIEPLAPPLQYPEHLPVSQYAVNIGLALRGMLPSKEREGSKYLPLNVNLLPAAYNPWRPTAKQVYAVVLLVAAIAVLFPLFDITNEVMGETTALQTKSDLLNDELERRKLEIKKREPIQRAINEYRGIVQRELSFIEGIEVVRSEAEKLGVKVGTISHSGSSITFSCQADHYLTFRDYLTALEETGRFTTPVRPPEGYPYTKSGAITLTPVIGEGEG